MLTLTLLLPATANAQEERSGAEELQANSTQVITGTMTIDCSTFTEADRERAIREGKNLCGALDAKGQGGPKLSAASGPIGARGSTVSDCGVASIYVDRQGASLRISYGLHSTQGAIITRSVTATWGPTPTGDNFDFGAVGQESYSNTLLRYGLPGTNAKAGATLRGTVSTVGWGFVCWVAADDPVHKL